MLIDVSTNACLIVTVDVLDQSASTVSLGLDYAVTDRVIIGAKYTRYGEISGMDSIYRYEADGNMVSLRAAIKF